MAATRVRRRAGEEHWCDERSLFVVGRCVVVTGLAGSGNSTFALALAVKTGLT
jgi:adenylylsulfate kinase-like enzyme